MLRFLAPLVLALSAFACDPAPVAEVKPRSLECQCVPCSPIACEVNADCPMGACEGDWCQVGKEPVASCSPTCVARWCGKAAPDGMADCPQGALCDQSYGEFLGICVDAETLQAVLKC
jgi:hypothetical protein